MNRRGFFELAAGLVAGSAVPAAVKVEPPDETGLVIDYAANHPDLKLTVVFDADGRGHMVPAGISHDIHEFHAYYDVKRAWILDDGRLEMERYSVCWVSKSGERPTMELDLGRHKEVTTYRTILKYWKLVTYDAYGKVIRERISQRT